MAAKRETSQEFGARRVPCEQEDKNLFASLCSIYQQEIKINIWW